MELDEWELSAEELESLEIDALRQIAQRNNSTPTTSASSTNPCISGANSQLPPLRNSLSSTTSTFRDSSRTQNQSQTQTQVIFSFPNFL